MKLRKRLFAISLKLLLFLAFIALMSYLGYSNTHRQNKFGYKKINEDIKGEIEVIINRAKGSIPNLQTNRSKASWVKEATDKHKEMMDKVLDTLIVLGESRGWMPDKYISATFYGYMQVCIPYNEENPYEKIVILYNNHRYIASANEDAVSAIVDYMKMQRMIKK